MASLYGILKRGYKRIVPQSWQRMTWSREYPFWRAIEPVKRFLQRWAAHDEIYDKSYYEETVDEPMVRSAQAIAKYIMEVFRPKSAVDVGCGTGALLQQLQCHGVRCLGLENSEAAITIARSRSVHVEKADLERGVQVMSVFDIAISMEVAEHLPASCADCFVDLLCELSQNVLVTAAIPGQGGTDHVNEQPNEYWISRFLSRGFTFQQQLTEDARRAWSGSGVAGFYYRNVMIFHGPEYARCGC